MQSHWPSHITESSEPVWFPWEGHAPRIILSSLVTVRRNLDGIVFPPFAGQRDQARLAYNTLVNVLDKHPEFNLPKRLEPAEILPEQREIFRFHNLADANFLGAADDRLLLLSPDNSTMCRINDRNHLLLQKYAPGLQLEKSNQLLQNMLSDCAMDLTFAWDSYFGYLCDTPELCGTGFTASVHLNIPAIIFMGYGKQSVKAAEELGFTLLLDKGEQEINSHLALLTARNLPNCTPQKIIARLEDFARRIVQHELDARKQLCDEPMASKFKDMVGRARALVDGAFLMSDLEILRTLSIFWLAEEMGFRVHPLSQRDFFAYFTRTLCQIRLNAKRKLSEREAIREAAERAAEFKRIFTSSSCAN